MAPRVEIDGLERDTVGAGAVSGLATGAFSIPEGMAYAQLAGVNPLFGLYSGMVATLVASLTTGTVLMISTLTSAIALSTGSVLDVADISDADMPRALFTITFMTGVVMLVLGLARLGSIVSFVSNSVMTGFVAGASFLIIVSEMGDFAGYDPEGANKVAQVIDWLAHIRDWDMATTSVGLATIVFVLVGKAVPATQKLAPVLVLVIMTVVVAAAGLESVATVADIASIPRGLPSPSLPAFALIPQLTLGSISVAIVALVQGAGISTAYPNPDGSRSSVDRDFVGQGLGNLCGSFFQSMGTGGSLSRTGISVGGGARSRWGGIFAAVWLGVLVLAFGTVAETVPLTVIAGLLFVIAAELIIGRVPNARLALQSSPGSVAAMALTFGAALFIPLQWTIFLGAGLSLVVYLASSFRRGTVRELVRADDGYWREQEMPDALTSGAVTVVDLRHWGFFAEAPRLQGLLPRPEGATGAVVVLRLRDIADIRATGLALLRSYHEELTESDNMLVLAGVEPEVAETLTKTGLADRIGTEHLFTTQSGITESLDRAVAHARNLTPEA